MDIKKLEKASKIVEKIKLLDAQIIEIDRIAMLVANGEIKSSFELKVEDIGKKAEDAEKVSFDEDGSITNQKTFGDLWTHGLYHFNVRNIAIEPKKENEHCYKSELTENGTLQILGILLYDKNNQRQILINKLKNYGISI